MAVQVGITEQGGLSTRPQLYVIDCDSLTAENASLSINDRRQALRRRRHGGRVRQALSAAGWAAGSFVLVVLVLAGMAGLRY